MDLTLQATGGLCNRLRAIDAALSLQKPDEKVKVIWENNHELGARYDELFEPNSRVKIVETKPFKPQKLSTWANLWNTITPNKTHYPTSYFLRQFLGREKKYLAKIYLDKLRKIDNHETELSWLAKERSVYIASCFRFWKSRNNFAAFIPIQPIRQHIDELLSRFAERTIGLHIRRTDHQGAIDKSPLYLFEQKIKEELSKYPKTKFFLATDDALVEKQLFEKYEDYLITVPKKVFNRSSAAGVQAAVVDVFALSKTQKIYGSHASSFSETAAQIGNIALEVCEL